MKKIYHLSTCSTCKKIMEALPLQDFEKQDIKTVSITEEQLDEMRQMAGSYEALFSRRSRNYSKLGLKDKILDEDEIRALILEDYTFLKRPVVIFGSKIFIGSDKSTVASMKEEIND